VSRIGGRQIGAGTRQNVRQTRHPLDGRAGRLDHAVVHHYDAWPAWAAQTSPSANPAASAGAARSARCNDGFMEGSCGSRIQVALVSTANVLDEAMCCILLANYVFFLKPLDFVICSSNTSNSMEGIDSDRILLLSASALPASVANFACDAGCVLLTIYKLPCLNVNQQK
jgi:hypothetical protein